MIFNVFNMTPVLHWMVFNFKATTINLRTDIVIKWYAHVLHDVSITVVKKIKVLLQFSSLKCIETVFLEILTENKTHKK